MNNLKIRLNGEVILDIDLAQRYSGVQRRFLDEMENEMITQGVRLNDCFVPNPDLQQCSLYMLARLLRAIDAGNQSMITACCAYLATRHADLNRIDLCDQQGQLTAHWVV